MNRFRWSSSDKEMIEIVLGDIEIKCPAKIGHWEGNKIAGDLS